MANSKGACKANAKFSFYVRIIYIVASYLSYPAVKAV